MGFFSDIFGGGADSADFPIGANFSTSTPGYSLSSSGSIDEDLGTNVSTTLTPLDTPERSAFLERFPRMLTDIDALRDELTPGYSKLRNSRIEAINTAERQAIGTLRQNAQRRKILGSQFVEDAVARIDLEAGKARGDAEAQSFLEEVDATLKVIDFEFGQINTALQRDIQELSLSTGMSQVVAQILQSNAAMAKNIEIANAQGAGNFLGQILGTTLGAAGAGIGANIAESVAPSSQSRLNEALIQKILGQAGAGG